MTDEFPRHFKVQYSGSYRDGPDPDDAETDGGTVESYCCLRCAFRTAFEQALDLVRNPEFKGRVISLREVE